MKRPRLNLLRTFEAAGRRRSFSLAAEELNISQAAVSQQIRNLEDYLGSPLFLRGNRKLALTSAGVAYHRAVHEALDRLDTVTDQLFPDRPHQTVTLGCTSSIATLWLAPRIRAFQRRHPGIDLRIHTLDPDMTTARTTRPDLEIFIATGKDAMAGERPLITSSIVPVAAPGLLHGQRADHASAILSYELIHVIGYDDDWHRWFRKYEVPAAVPRGLTVDGSLIAIEAAIHGDGVMLGRRPFIDHYLLSGQLVEVFAPALSLTAGYHLRRTDGKSRRRAVDDVVLWLDEIAGASTATEG